MHAQIGKGRKRTTSYRKVLRFFPSYSWAEIGRKAAKGNADVKGVKTPENPDFEPCLRWVMLFRFCFPNPRISFRLFASIVFLPKKVAKRRPRKAVGRRVVKGSMRTKKSTKVLKSKVL